MTARIGIIGKTNTGKTTFFNAATLLQAEISTYPFTTKTPNIGIAYTSTICVCTEFKVKDNPRNSVCKRGWRFIPIELVDLPGLLKGAWAGKGLGNQFLSVAAQSDGLLHVVDISGSVDEEGNLAEPGTGDPVADISDIEEELAMWYLKVLRKNEKSLVKSVVQGISFERALTEIMRGMGVTEGHVKGALLKTGLVSNEFKDWSDKELLSFAWHLRDLSKPTVIVANKVDLPRSEENLKRVIKAYPDTIVIPVSSEAELILRRAEQRSYVEYIPGEERFEVLAKDRLTDKQRWALEFIRTHVMDKFFRTGVQFAINVLIFKLLRMGAVYPVYDIDKLSDREGSVLPDVYLMPYGATVEDLARAVHSELAKGLLYAVDARDGLRLPANYILRDRDVIYIASATRKR